MERIDTREQDLYEQFRRQTAFDVEQARLRLLSDTYDHVTRTRLRALDISEGASCLEVGAGVGSVARILSELVGPTGSVRATDIDMAMLDVEAANVSTDRLDLLRDELPREEHDLV